MNIPEPLRRGRPRKYGHIHEALRGLDVGGTAQFDEADIDGARKVARYLSLIRAGKFAARKLENGKIKIYRIH